MTTARYRGRDYELLNVTEDAEFVLRDDSGDIELTEDGVMVQCERCGRFSEHVAPLPVTGRWVCHDADCYNAVA